MTLSFACFGSWERLKRFIKPSSPVCFYLCCVGGMACAPFSSTRLSVKFFLPDPRARPVVFTNPLNLHRFSLRLESEGGMIHLIFSMFVLLWRHGWSSPFFFCISVKFFWLNPYGKAIQVANPLVLQRFSLKLVKEGTRFHFQFNAITRKVRFSNVVKYSVYRWFGPNSIQIESGQMRVGRGLPPGFTGGIDRPKGQGVYELRFDEISLEVQ